MVALSYLDMCVLRYRAYNRVVGEIRCFFEIFQFEQQIGISEYFSWKVHGLSDFFSYQAHS